MDSEVLRLYFDYSAELLTSSEC